MNTFTITAYNKNTGVLTFNASYEGATYTGLTVTGCPKSSVEEVKAFIDSYLASYKAGKDIEAEKVTDIPAEVKALLNTTTSLAPTSIK